MNKLLIGFLLVGGLAMGQLRITEICPRPTDADPNGKESGWIELTNTSETETVDLADYALIRFNRGKTDKKGNRLKLLSQEVAPGERFVVYASEAYANFEDIGGSGAVEWLGESDKLMVYPAKINPKKYPTVRLYKGSELVDTFEVPVDLADGKSFAPGNEAALQAAQSGPVTRVILPTPTPGAANDLTDAVAYGPNIGPEVGSGSKGTGVTADSPAAPGAAYAVAYEIHPLS